MNIEFSADVRKNEAVLGLVNNHFGIEYSDLVSKLCATEHNLMMWMTRVCDMIRAGMIVSVNVTFGTNARVYLFPNGTEVKVTDGSS